MESHKFTDLGGWETTPPKKMPCTLIPKPLKSKDKEKILKATSKMNTLHIEKSNLNDNVF